MVSFAESRMAEEPNQMELESHRAVLLSPQNYHALASIQLGGQPNSVDRPVELHFSSFLHQATERNRGKVFPNQDNTWVDPVEYSVYGLVEVDLGQA